MFLYIYIYIPPSPHRATGCNASGAEVARSQPVRVEPGFDICLKHMLKFCRNTGTQELLLESDRTSVHMSWSSSRSGAAAHQWRCGACSGTGLLAQWRCGAAQ